MRSDSVNQAFARRARTRRAGVSTASAQRTAQRARMPSASGYMLATGAAAASLFFLLWFMLHSNGDEAPWVPAGLAASVVMLVAVAAREVVMRRAWARYLLEYDRREQTEAQSVAGGVRKRSSDSYSASLRALQRQSAEANAPGALPEAHLETYLSCQDYLERTEDALRGGTVGSESRVTLRAGQERARTLARQHLLSWARGASRSLTHEAQRRVRHSDKIETAQRALEVLGDALKVYPGEQELRDSAVAVRNFIASVKVAHWVELAERASFRGRHTRAIARYRDALFYLSRAEMSDDAREEAELRESGAAVREFMASAKVSHWVELAERAAFKGRYARAIDRYRDALFYLSREGLREETRVETAERIGREIEMLRARLKMSKITLDPTPHEPEKSSRRMNTE